MVRGTTRAACSDHTHAGDLPPSVSMSAIPYAEAGFTANQRMIIVCSHEGTRHTDQTRVGGCHEAQNQPIATGVFGLARSSHATEVI
jgi:hypothetical protein